MGAPNFTLLGSSMPEIGRLISAMLQARDAVGRRSWSHPQEPTSEDWWADVLADPRGRKRKRRTNLAVKQAFYRLADERREIKLVACSICDWRAAFSRDQLIASHGADYAMPNLLSHLAAPVAVGSARIGIAAACSTSSRLRAGGNCHVLEGRVVRLMWALGQQDADGHMARRHTRPARRLGCGHDGQRHRLTCPQPQLDATMCRLMETGLFRLATSTATAGLTFSPTTKTATAR
jgi:hypothetical protein